MRPRCYLVGSRVKTMAGQLWKFFYKLEDNYLKSQVKVHNTNKTLLWTDKSLLHKLFFALFPVAQHQHKTVVEAWTHQGWNGHSEGIYKVREGYKLKCMEAHLKSFTWPLANEAG